VGGKKNQNRLPGVRHEDTVALAFSISSELRKNLYYIHTHTLSLSLSRTLSETSIPYLTGILLTTHPCSLRSLLSRRTRADRASKNQTPRVSIVSGSTIAT